MLNADSEIMREVPKKAPAGEAGAKGFETFALSGSSGCGGSGFGQLCGGGGLEE
jgi:hypothetical protein